MPSRMPQAGPGSPAEATGLFTHGKRAEATSCLSLVRGEKGAEFSSWVEGDRSLARVDTSASSRDLDWEHRIKHAGYQQGSASPIWPMHTSACEKTSPLRNFTVLSQTTFFVCLYFLVCGGKCSARCGARAAPPRARWQ